jgi:hypothetical protein
VSESAKNRGAGIAASRRIIRRLGGRALQKSGRIVQLMGTPFLWLGYSLGFFSLYVTVNPQDGAHLTALIAALLAFLVTLIGGYLVYKGRQLGAKGKAQARLESALQANHPPVIYLRSFVDDDTTIASYISPFGALSTSREEQLAEAVAPMGTMVAIGEPGESLPDPGAMRVYVSDDQWQQTVNEWLGQARLVILRAGATQGLWWETQRAFEMLSPSRILILLLGFEREKYDSFADRLQTYLNIKLPEFDDVHRWSRVSGFFAFGDDWEPRFSPLVAPFLRLSPVNPLRWHFHYALRPVFQRLGISWQPARISRTRILALLTWGFVAIGFLLFSSSYLPFETPLMWAILGFLFGIAFTGTRVRGRG